MRPCRRVSDVVDEGLPTGELILVSDHLLGMAQGEGLGRRGMQVGSNSLHALHGLGRTGFVVVEKLAGLLLENV